jgi:hypothetical protein
LSTLRAGRPLLTRKISGTHFCWRLSRAQGHSAAGRIRSIEKSSDPIENRTRDLPTYSIEHQSTTLLFPSPHQHYLYHSTFHLFVLNFLSFRATFCFNNPNYGLIRTTSQLIRVSEGLLYCAVLNCTANVKVELVRVLKEVIMCPELTKNMKVLFFGAGIEVGVHRIRSGSSKRITRCHFVLRYFYLSFRRVHNAAKFPSGGSSRRASIQSNVCINKSRTA